MYRLLLLVVALIAVPAFAAERSHVLVVTLDGAITPATADYAVRGIHKAADQDASLVVLKLDTPGGLDSSMRSIIKAILASKVPVATFVAPDGARAASAGTYMLYASHVAAMAPATNLGAATPVQIGGGGDEPDEKPFTGKSPKAKKSDGKQDKAARSNRDTLREKQVNDAAAYIRSLAQMHGRNADWGEKAVRESVSLSASEAQKLKVVDLVARDIPDLLRQLNGRKVKVLGAERTLDTAGAEVVEVEPDWRTRALMVLTDPSVAVILMMIGVYGLLFEFMNPGFVMPGVLGAICLLMALFAFQLLPVNYAGVALILLGIGFIVAEAFVPSFGALGLGGIAALALGLVMLIDTEAAPGLEIPLGFIASLTGVATLLLFGTAYLALKARRQPIVSGREDLAGAEGEVLGDLEGEGWARVRGETWRIRSAVPLKRGERVRVMSVEGLVLTVVRNA